MRDLNSPEIVFEEVVDGRLLRRIEIILSEFLNNNKIPIEIKNCIEFYKAIYKSWYLCESPIAVASDERYERWKKEYERCEKEYEESLIGRWYDRNFKIFVSLNILVISVLLSLSMISIKNRNLKLGKI